MSHTEYVRPGDGSAGVLFVHGILGTPNHFSPLLPLVPEGWAIRSLLLPGHGGSVAGFTGSGMDAWREYVSAALARMRRENRRVLIAAHSMGCLFAIEEAIRGGADGLFLLNVPLYAGVKPRLFREVRNVWRGRIPEGDPWSAAARDSYSLDPEPGIRAYLGFVPRYMELFSEMRHVRRILPDLVTPCRALFSAHDEMVSRRSPELMSVSTSAHVTLLPSSGHYFYPGEDLETVKAEFRRAMRC